MLPDDLLILTQHLRTHLALIRPEDQESEKELREARSTCQTLIESLEALLDSMNAELAGVEAT